MKGPLTRFPITPGLFEISINNKRSGGATNPFKTAVQNKAEMGLMPIKLISIPATVETAMNI